MKKEKVLEIHFDLDGLKNFKISYGSFLDLYMETKQSGFDEFRLKAFEVLPLKKKIEYRSNGETEVLRGVMIKLRNQIVIHEHLEEDNKFLLAGTDFYELLYGYEEQVEKRIGDVLVGEYNGMVTKAGLGKQFLLPAYFKLSKP